jgi:hypothetical protein
MATVNTLRTWQGGRGGNSFTTDVGMNPSHYHFSKAGNLILPLVESLSLSIFEVLKYEKREKGGVSSSLVNEL